MHFLKKVIFYFLIHHNCFYKHFYSTASGHMPTIPTETHVNSCTCTLWLYTRKSTRLEQTDGPAHRAHSSAPAPRAHSHSLRKALPTTTHTCCLIPASRLFTTMSLESNTGHHVDKPWEQESKDLFLKAHLTFLQLLVIFTSFFPIG